MLEGKDKIIEELSYLGYDDEGFCRVCSVISPLPDSGKGHEGHCVVGKAEDYVATALGKDWHGGKVIRA